MVTDGARRSVNRPYQSYVRQAVQHELHGDRREQQAHQAREDMNAVSFRYPRTRSAPASTQYETNDTIAIDPTTGIACHQPGLLPMSTITVEMAPDRPASGCPAG